MAILMTTATTAGADVRERYHVSRAILVLPVEPIVRECVATRRFYGVKTDECLVHVVSLLLRSWGLLETISSGYESHWEGRAWRS